MSKSPPSLTMASSSHGSTHILVFPYPAQGHMLPLLDLTHQLALHNLTITVLVTPKNLPILTPLLSTHPSIQTLVFPFPHHPSLPPGIENVKDIGNHGNVPITFALGKLHDPVLQWFKSHHNPPVAIISDFFLGWTQKLAVQLGIPRIVFYSSGSFLTCVNNYCWNNMESVLPLPVVEFDTLPGNPSFKQQELPSIFRLYKESDPDWVFLKDGMIANMSSWGCIFNSFHALEGQYLENVRKTMGHERVWGVGPLSLTNGSGQTNPSSGSNLLTWLDGCPDRSVVYVCFGSQKHLKNDQMEALALGLERSGTRFVWVVNTGRIQDGYGLVPDGFEERVGERGLVIKGWAPQVLVLSHPAVGGFVSHCGWNSVLEGIVAGVMILAWPMEADQFVNAKLLVEDMGVAIRVCEGANTVPDSEELALIVGKAIDGCGTQRMRAKDLRGKALEAVQEGGSSSKDLNVLVKELGQLQSKKTLV